jgi:hypothetical protein
MSLSAATLLIPSPEAAWQLWTPRAERAGDTLENPSSLRNSKVGVMVGLPATACRSVGLVLPPAEREVLGQMIETHLEKHGLRTPEGGLPPHRWHLLGQAGGMTYVSVDVLAEPFPETCCVERALDYTAAPRLLDLPRGRLVVTEEQGETLVIAGFEGRLFRSHLCGPARMETADLATELEITRLSLESLPGFHPIHGITLLGSGWDATGLGRALGLEVSIVEALPRAGEHFDAGPQALLPTVVRTAREAARRRSVFIRASMLAMALLVSLVFLGAAYLTGQEREAAELERKVDATTAPAAAVRSTADAWKALAPAVDTNRFPMVLMAEITALMPPSGVVIRRFDAKLAEIELRGEARDAQLAYQFLEDLQKHRVLSRYTWTMPQPSVQERSASFRMQGRLK